MRERFRECDLYFSDAVDDLRDYLPANVLGVPTEREKRCDRWKLFRVSFILFVLYF